MADRDCLKIRAIADALLVELQQGNVKVMRAFVKSLNDDDFFQLQEEMRGVNEWGRGYLELLRITD